MDGLACEGTSLRLKARLFAAFPAAEHLLRHRGNVRWAVMSQIVTSGANFLTILVRTLGLEGFGLISICFLLIMILRNFLNGMVLIPMSALGPKRSDSSQAAYRGADDQPW